METRQLPIYQFLEGSGKSFIVLVYQRDYAWTEIDCQKLWEDLVDLKNNARVDHFLGVLVTIGNGWQEIHKKYLHTLGNLTLTAKNSELSNNTFEDRQRIDYQNSRLRLNFKLDGLTEWNEEKIIDRAKNLIKDAKEIWPFPKTTYTKPIPEEHDSTNEDSFCGSCPPSHLFEDGEIGINNENTSLLIKGINIPLFKKNGELIQDFVKRTLHLLLDNNLIPETELNNLQNKDYCKQFLYLGFPLFQTEWEKCLDSRGQARYWAKKLFGGKFYACSQWWRQYEKEYLSHFSNWLRYLAEINGGDLTQSLQK